MVKFVRLLTLPISAVMLVSCADAAPETVPETDPAESTTTSAVFTETPPAESEGAEIVLAVVYENYAWGAQQSVTVIDTSGAKYYYYTENEDDFIHLGESGWYDELYTVKQCEYFGNVSGEALDAILEFSNSFEQYAEVPFNEFDGETADYGVRCLYGFYTGENGEPGYVELCEYGDWVSCRDNEDVVIFANKMIETGVFPTVSYGDFFY